MKLLEWLKSKHYYNEIIKFNVTRIINNFAIKITNINILEKKLINYFLGNVNFNNLVKKSFEPKYIKIYVRLKSSFKLVYQDFRRIYQRITKLCF